MPIAIAECIDGKTVDWMEMEKESSKQDLA